MKYTVNERLLEPCREILKNRKKLFWIVGGSCAGKSTFSMALSKKHNLLYFDMDQYIFGKYLNRYSKEIHPASWEWFNSKNPLDYALSFSTWQENNNFNKATTAEQINIFCQDIKEIDENQGIIIDGGISNPAILARVLNLSQIFAIHIEDDLFIKVWESCKERQSFKTMIFNLSSPKEKWDKFLKSNIYMNHEIYKECKDHKIKVFHRLEDTKLEDMIQKISFMIND